MEGGRVTCPVPRAPFLSAPCPVSKETWYWDASNVTEMVLSGVKCTGQEMALSHCQQHSSVTCRKTGPRFAAGVICSESEGLGWAGGKAQPECHVGTVYVSAHACGLPAP